MQYPRVTELPSRRTVRTVSVAHRKVRPLARANDARGFIAIPNGRKRSIGALD